MRATVVTTNNLYNIPLAAQDLINQVENFPYETHSIGILFCDSEINDQLQLYQLLCRHLPYEVIGWTTISTFDKEGLHDMAISFMVITSDDCLFHTTLSTPLNVENAEECIKQTYIQCRDALTADPKLILTIPYLNDNIPMDLYAKTLSQISGGIPVFGGAPGFNAPHGQCGIFFENQVYDNRLLLILAEGALQPVFSIGFATPYSVVDKRTITKAKDNTIYKVDDLRFVDYLSSVGLSPEKLAKDSTGTLFAGNPLILRLNEEDECSEDIPAVRSLIKVDLAEGYGKSIGVVPEGAEIAIGSLRRKDMREMADKAVHNLLDKIAQIEKENPAYHYSTILATSCVGRYMMMLPDTDIEANILKEAIPNSMDYCGFYGYGALCPCAIVDNKAINRAPNISLVLCAF